MFPGKIAVAGQGGLGVSVPQLSKQVKRKEPVTPACSAHPQTSFPPRSMVPSVLDLVGLKVLGSSPLILSESLLVQARVSCIYTLPLYNKLEKVNSISVTGTRSLCPGGSRTDLLQGGRKKKEKEKAGKTFKGCNCHGGTPACF